MLVYLRKQKGVSQQALADYLGLSRSAVSMYEIGQREPELNILNKLAMFYDVDMNTLTGTTPTPPLDPKADEFARLFSQLPADEQKLILSAMRGMAKDNE